MKEVSIKSLLYQGKIVILKLMDVVTHMVHGLIAVLFQVIYVVLISSTVEHLLLVVSRHVSTACCGVGFSALFHFIIVSHSSCELSLIVVEDVEMDTIDLGGCSSQTYTVEQFVEKMNLGWFQVKLWCICGLFSVSCHHQEVFFFFFLRTVSL